MPWTMDGDCSYLFVYSVNVSSVSNKQAALPQGRLPFFLKEQNKKTKKKKKKKKKAKKKKN